jgi:hypothetical protein
LLSDIWSFVLAAGIALALLMPVVEILGITVRSAQGDRRRTFAELGEHALNDANLAGCGLENRSMDASSLGDWAALIFISISTLAYVGVSQQHNDFEGRVGEVPVVDLRIEGFFARKRASIRAFSGTRSGMNISLASSTLNFANQRRSKWLYNRLPSKIPTS